MLSNVGHTIQKMVNNIPVAVTANEFTTEVVTNGGNVYQTGLISGKINSHFQEVFTNENIVGKIVDAEATDSVIYLLNEEGSVFGYENQSCGKGISIREVYSPAACGGDKAKGIKAGRAHVLIRTEENKVYGAGNNEQYQLVPQGQCKYDTAVPILVTDTNVHDNNSCDAFTGVYHELQCPKLPECNKTCDISCVKDTLCDTFLGYLNITGAVINPCNQVGTLSVPIYGDLTYVGFLCVDCNGCASGNLTWSISRLYIKCGAFRSKFTYTDECGCHTREFNTSSTTEVLLFCARQCPSANTDLCSISESPLTGASQVNGKCGSCTIVNIDLGHTVPIPTIGFDLDCATIIIEFNGCRTSLAALCDTTFIGLSGSSISYGLDFDVPLSCAIPCAKPLAQLPQPCWSAIYAGYDISVLVDSCNRMYVFGSLHEVRSNKRLLTRSCLTDLLDSVNTSISFPADQLNCSKRSSNNNNCRCKACQQKPFKTDLGKFGIHLSFPSGEEECEKKMNACEFLQQIKKCNEADFCSGTCEPCDGYIYLNVDCGCGPHQEVMIGSVTLINKKSVCKLVSTGKSDTICVPTDVTTIVEFDLNKYCIDARDIALDKIVKLDFCNQGKDVIIYLDIDQPGGIKFESSSPHHNIEYTVSASTDRHQFILNFGSILDPVELTNLKYALSLDCYFPCAQYKNPFDTKITNTYLKGGDHVKFVTANPKNIRQAITADIPTVFRLNKKIVDVAVGCNNLTALTGGLACPNELFAIGSNCHGELGLGNNENMVCWKQLNRCVFNCQVVSVFAGKKVTFYVTQSHHVYASGQWKELVDSNIPTPVRSICNSWKIRHITITPTHIVLLGSDGCIFGLGDNTMGELGMGHQDYVCKPEPLVFFYNLNNRASKQFQDYMRHPCENRGPKQFDNCGPKQCDRPQYDDNCSNHKQGGRKPFKPYSPNGRIGYRC